MPLSLNSDKSPDYTLEKLRISEVKYSTLIKIIMCLSPATEFSIYFLVALILLTIVSLSVCLVSWSFFPPLSEIERLKQSGFGEIRFF